MKNQFYILGFLVPGLNSSTAVPSQEVELKRVGEYSTGIFDEGAAKIVSYDKVGAEL
jgi:hypothetical protein